MGCPAVQSARVYRPRRPRQTPLYRLVEQHHEQFQRVYAERYQKRYGFWRPVIADAIDRYLKCGDLRQGFARVRCPDCGHELFVAFSCRRRCLCPSCHQKRTLIMADRIAGELGATVPHRQFVWTIPKRLRIFFRFDRTLLGELARLAWQTVLEVHRAGLGRPDVVPGMVAVIHTFGQLVHFHPHIHAIVTDGAFTPDGRFIPMPVTDTEPYRRLWEQKVFRLLLSTGKITTDLVEQMRRWRHSGFSVDHRVALAPGDTAGLERLAQYMLRCPFSLARMIRVTAEGKVLYLAEKRACRRFPQPADERPRAPPQPTTRSAQATTATSAQRPYVPDPEYLEHLRLEQHRLEQHRADRPL